MWGRIKFILGWISFSIIFGEAALVVFVAYIIHANNPSAKVQMRSGGGPLFSTKITEGSGFFINDSGELLTNRHIVKSCRRISVAGAGFHGIRGKIIATSVAFDRDLAIIKIPIKPHTVANFLQEKPTYNDNLTGIHSPFVVVGFPDSDQGETPFIKGMDNVRLVHTKGTKDLFVEVDGPNERGDSGSPLFDGNSHVIGIMFAGTSSMKDLETQTEMSETGVAIYAPNIANWLKQSGINFNASNESQLSKPGALPISAVVEVFCFK